MKLEAFACPACGAPIEIQPSPYHRFNCPACGSGLMLTDFTAAGAIVCENCTAVNDPTERFCTACHAALQAGCPYCYALNPLDAFRCSKCGVDLQRAWSQQRSWLHQKQSYDSERRETTRRALLESRRSEIERLLVQLDEPQNHPMAIFCLQQYGQEAVEGLLSALTDPDPDARYGAAHTLGLIGDQRAIPALINALKDKEPAVRFWSADALGRLGAVLAVDALALLRKDPSRSVRDQAAAALRRIDTPEAISVLKRW